MRFCLLLVLLLASAPAAFAQSVRLDSWRVDKDRAQVRLVWETQTEASVQGYEIRRRAVATGGEFAALGELRSHGPASPYTFTDDDLYKASGQQMAEYQVWVVFTNGGKQSLFSAQVNYTSTGLRRTWGSLKAMFQ